MADIYKINIEENVENLSEPMILGIDIRCRGGLDTYREEIIKTLKLALQLIETKK